VEELQMANEYQLRLKDMNHNERIKELTDKFVQEKEELKRQLQQLRTEREKEAARFDEDSAATHDNYMGQVQEIEHRHNQRLMSEYEKYQELQQTSQAMQEKYEQQLRDMEAAKEKALKELAEFWENKLRQKSGQLDSANDTARTQQQDAEEMIRQIELDADQEILRLKLRYEKQLKEEREQSSRLKGDNGVLGKKLKSLQREIDEGHVRRQEMQDEQQRLHAHIKALEREISSCKREVEERDETIQDKEKRIYDLKKKNQELEKFKFVLDYKIKELKKQIEPREEKIRSMQQQVTEMDVELARYHETNQALELQLTELKTKLKASEGASRQQLQQISFLNNMIVRMRADIQDAIGRLQDPKGLASAVRSLHQKHCVEAKEEGRPADEDVQEEHNRQREFLERSIAALKKKLEHAEQVHRTETDRVVRENVTLIKEINALRKELHSSQGEVKHLEGTLRTTRNLAEMRGQTLPSKEETLRMSGVLGQTARETHELNQTERIIDMQKQEIRRLRESMRTLELTASSRPPSTGRLPPMEPSVAS
jgi:chromosome segregation ATPase